jgi:hypothetical protein
MKIHIFYFALLIGAATACNKANPGPILPTDEHFRVHIDNEFNELQGRYAVWLSDEEGTIRAFRWAPGGDTCQIEVADSKAGEAFDCTVARVFGFETPGSGGLRDTTITLTTYTAMVDGETIHLRNLSYKRTTDLSFTLNNVSSFDSIIVADGLTFVKPHVSNGYSGLYQVEHTGRIWFRVLANNDPHWRYLYFDNIQGTSLNLGNLDINLMTLSFVHPTNIVLPFTAAWKYKVDGVVDTATLQFLPLGDLRRAPGGAEKILSSLDVYEPVANADFMPVPKPYNSFRVQANATSALNGYTYYTDDFYTKLPDQLTAPAFDLEPTFLSDNRSVAVRCVGDFDLLSFTRNYNSAELNISWEVLAKPANGVIITNRLPDVPKELSLAYVPLGTYQFNNLVQTRAENYSRLDGYQAVVRQRLQNADPLWQAKGGYTGREELY